MQSQSISEYQPICPEESYNKITELYEEGLGEDEIAEELAFPLDIVTRYLEGNYTPPPYPELDQSMPLSECPTYGKIKDLYGEGWSKDEIAETLELPLDVVNGFISGNHTIISSCPEPYQKSEKNVTPKKSMEQRRDLYNKSPSKVTYDESSFVTIETPYGKVRVPQDVLEREGKEKIIAECSEAMKRRVITPPVKKVPEVTYVTIETPYGPLQVPKDFLESEGKEKIIATHVEFMKQLEELKRMEEQMRGSNKKSSDYRMMSMPCHANASDTKDVPSDKWANFVGEWAFFFRREGHSEPDLLYGRLDPHPLYNAGERFFSYQEREIYLNNDNDTIEFISNHLDTGQRDVWVALYDNTSEYPVSSFQLNFTDVDAPIEYYLIINSAEKKYDLWLKNTGTGDLRYRGYYDSDDPSDYIIHYTGSAELYYDLLDNEFRVLTDIKDDWTRIGSTWYRPNEIFYFCCYSDEETYVEVTASWDTDNFTYTSHETKYEGEDSYEPDNSFDQYSTMSVTTSLQSQSRSIYPTGDNDYIRFYAQADKNYIFYTEGSTDTYGYLYDSNQNQLYLAPA